MYKIRERFKDYNGGWREEDFYFNFNMAELTKLELSEYGGLIELLRGMISLKDTKKMGRMFEIFVDGSYGVRSADGRNFRKSQEILDDFKSTEAYSQIYTRFATDAKFAAEFINGIMPEDLSKQVADLEKNGGQQAALDKADVAGLSLLQEA